MNRHPHDLAIDPGLSPEEIVLDLLRGSGIPPTQLLNELDARCPGLSMGEASRAINALKADDLIERHDDHQRGIVLRWTERQRLLDSARGALAY